MARQQLAARSVVGPVDAICSAHAQAGHDVGIGHPCLGAVSEARPPVRWLEIQTERVLNAGGPLHRVLEALSQAYSLSLHGMGVSLGSTDELDYGYIKRLRGILNQYRPALLCEYAAWESAAGIHTHVPLPLPHNEVALRHLVDRVRRVQDSLGRRLVVENPPAYVTFAESTIPEPEFLGELAERSGCGLLLDLAGVHVNARNHGWDTDTYLTALDATAVHAFHLTGHGALDVNGTAMFLSTRNGPPRGAVWRLFRKALRRIGPRPTIVVCDDHATAVDALTAAALKAQSYIDEHHVLAS